MSANSLQTSLPGIFIVIEGVDGSGKTTLARALVNALNEETTYLQSLRYKEAIYVKEPGSTPFGDAVRKAFLSSDEPLNGMTEVLAMLACKNELLQKVVRPAIAEGTIVIGDRYTRTLLAYQGGLRGYSMELLTQLLDLTGTNVSPNMEIFLEVSPEVSRARRPVAENAFDTLADTHATKLREGFALAKEVLSGYYTLTIDASGTMDDVFKDVLSAVKRYLKLHRSFGNSLNNQESISSAYLDSLNPDNDEVMERLVPHPVTTV